MTAARTLSIGLGQVLVVPGELDANLSRAVAAIGEAATAGCDVVVLPECLDLGWTWPDARSLAGPIPGDATDRLAAAARDAGIHVVAGVTELDGDRLFNSAVFLGPDGALLAKHRKINELDFARAVYAQGGSLQVVPTPLGVVGIDICADNAYPSLALGRALAAMGAEVLLSPCAWAVPPGLRQRRAPLRRRVGDVLRRARAGDGMPVVGVSNVGPVVGGEWDGWRCIGASLVVGRRRRGHRPGAVRRFRGGLVVVEVALR